MGFVGWGDGICWYVESLWLFCMRFCWVLSNGYIGCDVYGWVGCGGCCVGGLVFLWVKVMGFVDMLEVCDCCV